MTMEITTIGSVFIGMAHILGIVILGYLTLVVIGVIITTVISFTKDTKERLKR